MDFILKKAVPVICTALAAPLVLSSCSRTISSSEVTAPASSTAQEQVFPAESDESAESAASSDESWKTDFEKSLWEITMSPRNTMKIWGTVSIRSTSKLMEKPCPMFA